MLLTEAEVRGLEVEAVAFYVSVQYSGTYSVGNHRAIRSEGKPRGKNDLTFRSAPSHAVSSSWSYTRLPVNGRPAALCPCVLFCVGTEYGVRSTRHLITGSLFVQSRLPAVAQCSIISSIISQHEL